MSDYEILGVDENADMATVKAAYRKRAFELHPDHNKNPDAQDRFVELAEAYDRVYQRLTNPWYTGDTVSGHRQREASQRARSYAQMRYEEFRRKTEAQNRLPINQILWGKKFTYVLIVLSLLALCDLNLPRKVSYYRLSSFMPDDDTMNASKIAKEIQKSELTEQEAENWIEGDVVKVDFTALYHLKADYRLKSENYKEAYEPNASITEYWLMPWVIIVLSIVSLKYKKRNLENKLLIRFVTLICFIVYGAVMLLNFVS